MFSHHKSYFFRNMDCKSFISHAVDGQRNKLFYKAAYVGKSLIMLLGEKLPET